MQVTERACQTSWQMFGVKLERVTLEPKVRMFVEDGFGVGADVAVSTDLSLNDTRSRVAINLGYIKQSVWFKFGFLALF
ncbi:MAG: hypothetical protein ACRCYY_10875 [Trueperaceae bacterium]